MSNNNTNIRSTGQLREGTVSNVHISSDAAIALSKLAETVIKADGLVAFTGNQSLGGYKITNLGSPTSGTDAVNRNFSYDNIFLGHKVKAICTENIEGLSGLIEVDGYQTLSEDVILLVGQTDQTENGVYYVYASDWVRFESLAVGKHSAGFFVFATNGTVYKSTGWLCTSLPGSDIVGSNNLIFRQFTTQELGVFQDSLKVNGDLLVYNDNESDAIKISHTGEVGKIETLVGDLAILPYTGQVAIGKETADYELDVVGDINFTGDLLKSGVSIGNSFENYVPFFDVFNATQDQTVFVLTGVPFSSSDEKYLLVTKNGVVLENGEYSLALDSGDYKVTLSTGCDAGDIITIRPFGLATVISTVELNAGNLLVPNELQVGENSVHITDSAITGNDPNGINGTTITIDIVNGDATFDRDLSIGRDCSVNRNLGVTGDLTVTGNLTINGTTTTVNTATLEVEDNVVLINKNETGAGVTAGTAGIEIERGTADNYLFQFRESDDTFVIGVASSLQAVATREDSPNNLGVPYWDYTTKSFKTRSDVKISSAGQISAVTAKITGAPTTPLAAELYAGTVDPTDTTRLNYNGYLYATRVYNAVWNDVAECMPSDGSLKPGDLAQVDLRSKDYRLTKFSGNFDAFVGIISENPGIIVGENDKYENKVYVVLRGMIYTDKIGIYPVGTMLYITPDGVKTRSQIRYSYNYFDVYYIGRVIEAYEDKIRIFV